jgi:4-hydroxythreonine-4-phosphate dehydrogenase
MVVIADDLTGAADCAASSAASGRSAVVLLHSPQHQQSHAAWPDTDILSIDTNSRSLSGERGTELISRLVRLCDSRNADCPGYVLYKKIDSTLRGNVAGEIAALLNARRSINPATKKLSILVAPALPTQGRITVGGRLLVHGVPLEKTDVWQFEACAAQSDIVQLLSDAGLSCGLVGTNTVRSCLPLLQQAITQSAIRVDVVVCDAETDDDLRAIAKASLGNPSITAFVGSAGLATHIPQAIGIAPHTEPRPRNFVSGATLFVVGSAASVSRQQTRILECIPDIATFRATPAVLHKSPMMCTQIVQTLQSSRDVLIVLDGGEHCSTHDGQFLTQALSDLVSRCAQFLGALVATGGETARAVLDALGIQRLRLLGEVEAGLPFSVADGWTRSLLVITKAGAFGSPQALVSCREFLRHLERVPVRLHPNHPFADHES